VGQNHFGVDTLKPVGAHRPPAHAPGVDLRGFVPRPHR